MLLRSTEVFLNTDLIGVLSLHKGNKLRFDYDSPYASNPQSIPLSYSMPLTEQTHDDRIVRNFLWEIVS